MAAGKVGTDSQVAAWDVIRAVHGAGFRSEPRFGAAGREVAKWCQSRAETCEGRNHSGTCGVATALLATAPRAAQTGLDAYADYLQHAVSPTPTRYP